MTTSTTTQAHIDRLAASLKQYRDAYYNGTPLVSDSVFDSLEDELRRLDPTNPILLKIGAPVPQGPAAGGFAKVTHTIPMTSLNKANTLQDMEDWYKGCKVTNPLIVMDKLDGGSLSVHYHKRKLVQAVTRGDGLVGQDVTRNALLIQGMVKMLPPTLPNGQPTPDDVWIRGEVVILHSDFAKHFPGESNPRNSANGTLVRQSDNAKCAYLSFRAYNLMPNGVSMVRKAAELASLVTMGFEVPQWDCYQTLSAVEAVYQDYVARKRKATPYDIDGLVIEFDNTDAREGLGDLNGRPKGSVAYKFPHEEKETILRDIEWQVGKSGRVTPVAIFDSVNLGGANVTRASLAGVRQVLHLKLFPGCRILVARMNDVIPRVEANLDEGIVNDL